MIIAIFVIVLLCSYLITSLVRRHSINKAILDMPNERSAHYFPTPRGGGIAIILTFFVSLFLIDYLYSLNVNFLIGLIGGGCLIAAIGYLDDLYSLKATTRLLIHFVAAIWTTYWLINLDHLSNNGIIIANLVISIAIVWCINLYNFMDGLDGLASSQGVFVSLVSSLALYFTGSFALASLMLLLAAAIFGFTIWNWPPAKIFLGDVGSGFLGYLFAAIAFYTWNKKLLSLSFWGLLLSIFIIDTSLTLLYRIYHKKKWYQAHREHAYQILLLFGANHKQITIGIIGINVMLVLPAIIFSLKWPALAPFILSILLLLLVLAWIWLKFISNKLIINYAS